MSTVQLPSESHVQFDEICAPVDDFEPLPTVVTKPTPEGEHGPQGGDADVGLDGLILAGLVTPF